MTKQLCDGWEDIPAERCHCVQPQADCQISFALIYMILSQSFGHSSCYRKILFFLHKAKGFDILLSVMHEV